MGYVYLGAAVIAACAVLAMTLVLWNKPIVVIYCQIAFCSVFRYLTQQLFFPDSIKYLTDFLTTLLLVQTFLAYKKSSRPDIRAPMLCVGIFALVTLASFFINNQSFLFLFWGARTIFRYYIFFAACTIFLSQKDIGNIIRFLITLLPVNMVCCLFQYFAQGLRDDYVGGLFGIEKGCNAEMNLYLVIIAIIVIVLYISGKLGFIFTATLMAMSLIIAALSELKMLFFEIIIILVLIISVSFPNKRAFYITAIGISGIYGAIMLFLYLYPSWSDFFSFEQMLRYSNEESYTSAMWSLNRLSALPYIYTEILVTPLEKLFGFGLGNTDYFLGFVSNVYARYSALGYNFFGHSFISMELGALGIFNYCIFFVCVFVGALRAYWRSDRIGKPYCLISISAAAITFVLNVYNQSLRLEYSYAFFLILSFSYIVKKEQDQLHLLPQQ